jgi:hypothetical protein
MATQHQEQPKRGRGRPKVETPHTPCAFTYTVHQNLLADLQRIGISADKAKRLARQAANAALINILQQKQNASI